MNPQYVQQPMQKAMQGGSPYSMSPAQQNYYTNGSVLQRPPNLPPSPSMAHQNLSSGSVQGQQNLTGPPPPGQNLSTPILKGMESLSVSSVQAQQNAANSTLQGQQGQQNMSNSPLSVQHNASPPFMQPNMSDPAVSAQQNLPAQPSKGRQHPSDPSTQVQQNSSRPPVQGQQNLPMPPLQGQQDASNSPLIGPPKISHPPLQGQQHLSPTVSQAQQGTAGLPLPGPHTLTGPLSHGHEVSQSANPQMQQNVSGQLLQGQQSFSASPLPGQQNFSMPPMQGQQNYNSPLQQSQQNLSGIAPQGQQTYNSPLSQGQQNFSRPILQGQQNLSGPMLLGQKNVPGQSSQNLYNMPGSLLPNQHNVPNTMPSVQQNLHGPPPSMQHNLNAPPPPSMSTQQNFTGQSITGSLLPGQKTYGKSPLPDQNTSVPNLQSQMTSPTTPGQHALGQRQYVTGPPLPGQPMGSPTGLNLQSPSATTAYQQGGYPQQNYQNQTDMYGGQRSPYQSGAPGGYQPGIQPQQTRRLDPEQMPSPIQVMQDDQRARGGVFVTNQKGLVPPLVTTKFVVQDQGNSSPRYIRSTMYTVPTTADIIKQTNVPFGLIISPMAQVVEGEYEPPIVDMGTIGPVRCVRCKAYMSPFMQFIDAGRRFQCMFCKATTEVPAEYFQHLDHTGQRMDRYERPELMLGTYEYIATEDYCRNNTFPKPPAIVFVIDVSYNTVKSGLVNLLCAKMKSILQNLPVDAGQSKTNMKVGFITYNNTVHFYNINSCLAQPQMMVVGDVQDVFMPLLDGFLCDIDKSEAVIDSLMTQIPEMFADTRETETILAPAIQAGLEALKAAECIGKLIVFHSSLPIAEAPGKLKNRDDRKLLGTEKERTVLAPQNNVYNNLGQECVNVGCSVDLFIFNNSYVDLATIGQVSRLTGGQIYKYTYFQSDIDGERLITDVISNIKRPIAFDAVMRVRTSTGVRATEFYGHFFMSNTTDMELASIDSNKAIAIEIKHDDKLTDDEGVYIQAALLYTSCGGVRRLRIMNLSLKTSPQMAELYRACDLDAILNFFSKQSVFKLIESTPKTVKDQLISRCANMLAAYRKHCASPSSAGQLILPECMKLLPLYINSLIKSDAISGGADMTIDDRSFVMQAAATMPVSISVVYIYPRLYPLHDVDPNDPELPQILRCSIDKFTDDGVYLLENSIHMFLWLGLAVSPQWIQGVFGVPSVVQVDTDRTALPVLENPLNKRIGEIINQVRTERNRSMRLTVVRQRDKLEMVLRHFLIEDRGNDGSPSYVDFLCHMHKEIRMLLSQ